MSLILTWVCLEQLEAFDIISTCHVGQPWTGDVEEDLCMLVIKDE